MTDKVYAVTRSSQEGRIVLALYEEDYDAIATINQLNADPRTVPDDEPFEVESLPFFRRGDENTLRYRPRFLAKAYLDQEGNRRHRSTMDMGAVSHADWPVDGPGGDPWVQLYGTRLLLVTAYAETEEEAEATLKVRMEQVEYWIMQGFDPIRLCQVMVGAEG